MTMLAPSLTIRRLAPHLYFGRVSAVMGLMIEIGGIAQVLSVGSRCVVTARSGSQLLCEVVGFRGSRAVALPFGALDGIGIGCRVEMIDADPVVYPSPGWLGRVVNALGEPLDGKGPLRQGAEARPIKGAPPAAHARQRVRGKVDLGVRAINTFTTCCRGQRMGIFAGSGVGKSTLLSMMARYTSSDVCVIGLVGERGREVQEFLEDDLGPDGLARSVVVVATSDEPPLMRRQAAYLTMAIAEYFRDRDSDVLCLMDSVTRFAMAQREIGLSAGEPPASKGYTPSVFAELPKVLERAGPGTGAGSITGLFTVLVDGDDHNEPIADAVRGIRARPLSGDQHPEVDLAHDAGLQLCRRERGGRAGAAPDRAIRGHGRTDPSGRLSPGERRAYRRGDPFPACARRVPWPDQDRTGLAERMLHAVGRHPRHGTTGGMTS
jgi:flagellum-specific ATP synthase